MKELSSSKYYLVNGLRLNHPDQDTFVCHHETSGRYFRISEQLFTILTEIEKGLGLDHIAAEFSSRFGVALSVDQLTKRLDPHIGKLVIKEKHGESTLTLKEKPSYLKLSRMILPAKHLESTTDLLSVLFYKRLAVVIIVAYIFGLAFSVATNYNLIQAYYSVTSSVIIIWYVIFMAVSSMFHELGHATACKFFGAKHGGIGIGFYLLSPVMYADVTDAWKLSRNHRIVINLAGIYFEIIIGMVMIISFLLLGNIYLLTLAILSLVKITVNLNPFFRTDGYWVLSDLSGISNLRFKSNKVLIEVLKKPKSLFAEPLEIIDWRKFSLAAYSAVSYIFMSIFVYYVLFKFEGSLISFPMELKEVYFDYSEGSPITALELGKYLQKILVPIMFYYLLFNFVIKRLIKKQQSNASQ